MLTCMWRDAYRIQGDGKIHKFTNLFHYTRHSIVWYEGINTCTYNIPVCVCCWFLQFIDRLWEKHEYKTEKTQ